MKAKAFSNYEEQLRGEMSIHHTQMNGAWSEVQDIKKDLAKAVKNYDLRSQRLNDLETNFKLQHEKEIQRLRDESLENRERFEEMVNILWLATGADLPGEGVSK